ncbi:hypothetical protein K2173_000653 [Erythroxylum novogranatense]|uniref:Seipin n=1 Tax=Erythroxylum novogranatense TaxID=1862640 RepID=A0AAV8SI55_9ROSI|nr:hypothetical protein K2173_000653 [Erythroxylum novogranatense]
MAITDTLKASTTKEDEEHKEPQPEWLSKLVSFQAALILDFALTIFSPVVALFSVASHSYRRAEQTTTIMESAILKVPSTVTHSSSVFFRKMVWGILGAVHVSVVLTFVMIFAAVLGIGFVQLYVEEPVFMREKAFFDYTDVNPKAIFHLSGVDGDFKKKYVGIPVGHTFQVSLTLWLPDSDFNRQIGVFQLTSELISANGNVTAKSSQPCMLPFRSPPVRLARTLLMSFPILIGIAEETQKISIQIIKHKERYPTTEFIKITMYPRAGTSFLPQFYEAEILVNSKLPWIKALIRNWKWTFYVWTSIYVYIIIVILILCCCRPLLFSITAMNRSPGDRIEGEIDHVDQLKGQEKDEVKISELVKRLQQRRRKRKAIVLHGDMAEAAGSSSAYSMSFRREDASIVIDEDIGDSESVCSVAD